ncbi:MAG: autotransporter outer membrane beta-barrel domain-containing protein, partial [Parvibaculales bacterium]
CSWTSFKEQSVGDRNEQAITSGRQAPLGDNWVSMVAAQYKKVELVDRVEGHARDSETYLLGAGLRSRSPIANVADVSVSLTMGRGEHRRNREWASVQQASMPEMNFQVVRIGASRSFALPLKGSWEITPSTDYNLVRVDVSDLQHEAVSGESVFAIDDMEHNRQSVRAGLELRGSHESKKGSTITAFARVGVEHYINGRSAGYTIRLVGASQGFTYYGRPIDENVLTTSFGITKARGKTVSFRAFYEGKQGINGIYENHEAKLELLKRF